eukprot:GHVU01081683.1.p1 GENE.GHVU01081683.1~~GHVU01081683.1.p1  ORF type:complete len:114 (+),score=8.71 GHVU01081683.1:1071-1412(+)
MENNMNIKLLRPQFIGPGPRRVWGSLTSYRFENGEVKEHGRVVDLPKFPITVTPSSWAEDGILEIQVRSKREPTALPSAQPPADTEPDENSFRFFIPGSLIKRVSETGKREIM